MLFAYTHVAQSWIPEERGDRFLPMNFKIITKNTYEKYF